MSFYFRLCMKDCHLSIGKFKSNDSARSVTLHTDGTLSEMIHGNPAACASIIESGNPSYKDGNKKTSIACSILFTSPLFPKKSTESDRPRSSTFSLILLCPLPVPTRSSLEFLFLSCTLLKTSIKNE